MQSWLVRIGPSLLCDAKGNSHARIYSLVPRLQLFLSLQTINRLNWVPLAKHRKRQKLLLCRHILLRGSISVFIPHPHPSQRLYHNMVLYCLNKKTLAHLYSFFPSVIKFWNKLPLDSISANHQTCLKKKKTLSGTEIDW